MRFKKSIALLLVLLASGAVHADDQKLVTSFSVTDKYFSYERGHRKIRISLKPTMYSWVVNCARTRAVVWGVAKVRYKLGEVPYSRVYLINVENDKIMNQSTTTDGPYDATFTKDQKFVRVISFTGFDLASGHIVDTDDMGEFVAESCPTFPGKERGVSR